MAVGVDVGDFVAGIDVLLSAHSTGVLDGVISLHHAKLDMVASCDDMVEVTTGAGVLVVVGTAVAISVPSTSASAVRISSGVAGGAATTNSSVYGWLMVR